MPSTGPTTDDANPPRSTLAGVRETLISIVIAFTMAFVFRGYVIEGFVIPTGSMAPTLMGKHVLAQGETSGYAWPVGPWEYSGGIQAGVPLPTQTRVEVTDPITNDKVIETNAPLRSGDRVFVLKYLPIIHEPKRWDVAVFKNPATPENYIKRIVGMPGEQLALVDGDVFTRPLAEDGSTSRRGPETWQSADWSIERKPERIQRTLLQLVHDTAYTPPAPGPEYRSPWIADRGFEGLSSGDAITKTGDGRAVLAWRATRPITDAYTYNEVPRSPTLVGQVGVYPVSDVALTLAVEPEASGVTIAPELTARGMTFRATIGPGEVAIERLVPADNRADGPAAESAWQTIDTQPFAGIQPGRTTLIEFWHVDQAIWVFADGEVIAGGAGAGAYALTPAQRLEAATGRDYLALVTDRSTGDPRVQPSVLANPELYRKPSLRVAFEGGPLTLHRVRLDRDVSYQLSELRTQVATRGGHPELFPTLDNNRYFVCGDNSPSSKDSRLWRLGDGSPDAWKAQQIDPKIPTLDTRRLTDTETAARDEAIGTVHRDLLVGQGFVVYLPAPMRAGPLPVPDVGRMRWIW